MAIRIVFLWHMHQPYYKDLVSGEYRLPWVRMHALKDYYGMVKVLDEFPSVHQTFNLVPSLLTQLDDYVTGAARDPFFDVAARPVGELTAEDRRFGLQYLFQANPTHMIGRYPRYHELWERFRGFGQDPKRAEPFFTAAEFTDLQVLSQLAWFDEFFLDEPEIAALVRKGRGYSLEDQRFVTERERDLMARVLPAYRGAAERGLVEVSTSPFYHPILPLLCDTNAGAASSPGLPLPSRFQRPDDAREQLRRAIELHEQLFGARPRGVWPSEGSVSEAVLAIAHELGIGWMATDEGVLGRSTGSHFLRDHDGRLPADAAARLYNLYRYRNGGTEMNLIFRDHALSDLIGFVYSGMPPQEAADHLIRRIKESARVIAASGRDVVVPIVLDGENAWEYYPRSGREFLRRLYDGIARDAELEALTMTEAIARHRNFGELGSLAPGSWINANFNVWIGAPEDNRAWDELGMARDFYERNAAAADPERRALAFEELLIAEGSDWNWWYGPEHHSANDREFDELYRKHLSNVYQLLGAAPPESLAQAIGQPAGRPYFVPQTAYVHPRIGDAAARYFDWLGAAMYTHDRTTSAMHGRSFFLDVLQAGIDEESLYVHVEFAGGRPPSADEGVFEAVLAAESLAAGTEKPAHSLRLTLEMEGGAIRSSRLVRDPQPAGNGDVGIAPDGDQTAASTSTAQDGLLWRLRDALEAQIPLRLLSAGEGSRLRVRVTLWRARLPVDALPLDGWIELKVAPEHELSGAGNW
ncbi:MAG TPA: glycoside hydrolase family 57 protein [Terriglobales bacterium]|nr:glycoside hydrolase family 57 protein [Terriglobales bacterium]